jgi:hypothetical protein
MATPASIRGLPAEILSEIVGEVRLASPTTSALLPCLLVCRKWSTSTLPYLYGNLVLTAWNLRSFLEHFDFAYRAFVKFLTVRGPSLTPNEPHSVTRVPSSAVFAGRLRLLPYVIAKLSTLTSFSFICAPKERRPQVTPGLVISLLNALPESCVDLELDTGPFTVTSTSPTHICDSLRRIFPRMRRVRLYLRSSCSSLFEGPPESQIVGDTEPKLQPISLLNMETLTANCYRDGHYFDLPT